MYLPKHFEVNDVKEINQFIATNAFTTLTTSIEGELEANHIPVQLLLDADGKPSKLQGHFARLNPLVRKLKEPQPCLCVFLGADCYITPNWYDTKKQTGMAVPTWDYQVAHVHGTLTLIDDDKWLLAFLNRLTEEYESDQPIPWKVGDAPDDYIDAMCKAIIGFEIEVHSYTMKSKLNQNHSIGNQSGIVEGIGDDAGDKQKDIGLAIKRNLDTQF
ncbi:MAG: transcriptional regulator [Saprospiraceae bacterium]|jgi:transcriptional regulator